MKDLTTIDLDSLYCMLKGEPGTRKSTAALSFPKPIYFFDWDNKMDALVMPMKSWGIDPKDISYDIYTNWDAAKQQLEKFQSNCKFKTLVIDSITSLGDAITRQVIKQKGSGETGKKVGTISVSGFDEFNAEDSALKEMVALTKDIKSYHKINIVLIAHVIQKEVKSPDGKTHMSRMIVTAGKTIAQKIPAYCSEVYHFNIKTGMDTSKGGQYAIKTTHTGDDFARSSLNLPEEIVFGSDPLYDGWIKPAITKLTNKP